MKQKMSITIEQDKIKLIEKLVEKGIFRNKSHALEIGIDKMLNELRLTQEAKNEKI